MPVLNFPRELPVTEFEIVIHMIPMGEADAPAVQAFAGHAKRLVALRRDADVFCIWFGRGKGRV